MEKLSFVTWLGHSSFYFTEEVSEKRVYYIDPLDLHQTNLPKADLLFITHAHSDHCSPQDAQKIMTNDTTVIAPIDCLENLQVPQNQQYPITPHESHTVKDFSFITLPAYNVDPNRLYAHPKENNWVGYVFTINNKKIYHAGDTDIIPEMETLKNLHLDIALLPMGGTYTMDAHEAAQAANIIQAKVTVPMHYKRLLGGSYTEAEDILKKEVIKSTVVIMKELQ